MNEELENQGPISQTEPLYDSPQDESQLAVSVAGTMETENNNRRRNFIIGAVIVVGLLLLGLWYVMERNGQVNTNLFSGFEQARLEREVIVEVNGEIISAYDLSISQQQIAAAARAQGVDVTDPDTIGSIKEQAIEMLINTELLRQEAKKRNITVSEDEVEARYNQLITEVGGEEILAQRMNEFGVTEKILFRDIKNELTIQKLLDEVFASSEEEMVVSEAEVKELYDSVGGEAGGLPALEEVREQIVQQIKSTKEQQVVNNFVETLRTQATIDIKAEL